MAGSGASSLHDCFDYQARVFKTLVIFHGPVPRSCPSLPLLPFRSTSLLDSFTKKLDSPVCATVHADSPIILLFAFGRTLVLL